MSMDVDEARGDGEAIGIDHPAGWLCDSTHLGDAAALDGNVGGEARLAGSVDNLAASNDQIELRGHLSAALSLDLVEAKSVQAKQFGASTWFHCFRMLTELIDDSWVPGVAVGKV